MSVSDVNLQRSIYNDRLCQKSFKSFDADFSASFDASVFFCVAAGFCAKQYSHRALGTRCAGHLAPLGWNWIGEAMAFLKI